MNEINRDPKLDEIYRLVKENNETLQKMRRSQKWSNIFRLFYWIIVLGLGVGVYVYLEPYLKGVLDTYGSVLDTFNSFR